MRDPLALYAAVMGRLWEDEPRRGRAGAAVEARLSGRRQGRSWRQAGRGSARQMLKAATGRSRAAVFKRIRAGGCKTKGSLAAQLAYVNDKASFVWTTMAKGLGEGRALGAEVKSDLVEDWSATWRGSTKLGFTSHMLLSFPSDVPQEKVRDIALDWAEHFFESGLYGDRWDYVLAVHDDRDHGHAHILLNNRGSERGHWFSCWEGGVMSPQLMREKQAEIAGGYGIVLEATSRLERGIFEKAPGLADIYAVKAEGRRPSELAPTSQERAIAESAVVAFAKDYRRLADHLDRIDRKAMARMVRDFARCLGTGLVPAPTEESDMKDIETVGEAIDYAERALEAIRLKSEELGGVERARFEVRAAPVIRDLSRMVPDPDLEARFGRTLVETWPPGANDSEIAIALRSGSDPVLARLLDRAEAAGLDREELIGRYEASGTRSYGLAQDWVERDMNAVLAREGLNVSSGNEPRMVAALGVVDAFADGVAARIRDLGAVLDDDREDSGLSLIEPDDRAPNTRLADLAEMLREGRLDPDREAKISRSLQSELFREIGTEGLAELRRGNFSVLAEVLPGRLDQITVTQEYLEMVHEETGDARYTDRAAALQQDKALEVARGLGREAARELDDDLGL